jgi:phage shock protein C
MKKIIRSHADKKIAGICSGIAHAIDIDPTIVRLSFIVLFATPFPIILFYLLSWIVFDIE